MNKKNGHQSRFMRFMQSVWGVLLQLLIVFVGVYAAFYLENRREARVQRALDVELYTLMIGEVESVAYGMNQQLVRFDSLFYGPFVQQWPPSEPLQPYYQINGDLSSDEVSALIASRDTKQDSLNLLYALRFYRGNQKYFVKVSDEFRRASLQYIAPVVHQGKAAFYTADAQLKPEFYWYPSTVSQLRSAMAKIVRSAENMERVLRAIKEEHE
ncbi:MAG: hypothetical protein AAF564_11960 [Bacteroidota bacterium]